MPDQRTRRNADTRARLEEQRLARESHRRESVVEAVVKERALSLPFGNFEALIQHGEPHEVGDLVEQLQMFEQDYAPRLYGLALIRMKDSMPRGDWQGWMRTYWHKSEREAQRYMRQARGGAPRSLRTPKTTRRVVFPPNETEIVEDVPADAKPADAEEAPLPWDTGPVAHIHCSCVETLQAFIKELERERDEYKAQVVSLTFNREMQHMVASRQSGPMRGQPTPKEYSARKPGSKN